MMQPRRILLVDDESYVTSLLASKLERLGDEVHIANDGAEAFELALQIVPDLIVTDFQMPIMSGFELGCRLKLDPITAQIPLIMLTAREHLLSPSDLLKTNVRQLLSKPFSAKELITKIEDIIGPARQCAKDGGFGAIAS